MPTVSTESYRLHDEEAKKRRLDWGKGGFKKITTFSSKDRKLGGFKCLLPDYMTGVLGTKFVRGASLDEIDEAFDDKIREYNFRISSKRKVVLYSFLANVDTVIDGEPFIMESLGLHGDRQKYGTGLTLWYVVCWETQGHPNEDWGYKFFSDDGRSVDPPRYHNEKYDILEYTPEREEFFKALSKRIAIMTFNAHAFLTKKDKLLELIDSSRALTFFPESEKKEK